MNKYDIDKLIEHLKHDGKWDNCESCGLFRQLNCWLNQSLKCRDCMKKDCDV